MLGERAGEDCSETDRQTDRQTDRWTHERRDGRRDGRRGTETERDRQRQTDRDRHGQTGTDRQRQRRRRRQRQSPTGHKSRRYMLDFVFTGSESNVKHGRSIQQGPFRAREAVFDGAQGCRLPAVKPLKSLATSLAEARPPSNPSNPSNPSTGLSKATSLAGIHATLCFYWFRKQR